MDIDFYMDDIDKWKLDHQLRMQRHGHLYHWDPKISDPPNSVFKIIGRFTGDWQDELYWAKEHAERTVWGDDQIVHLYPLDEHTPTLMRMVEFLKLRDLVMQQVQIQNTNHTVIRHLDDFTHLVKEDGIRPIRFLITLHDWEPGQYMIFGNSNYTHWQAGEVLSADFEGIPHGTANCSWNPRQVICCTGFATDETQQLIANGFGEFNIEQGQK
jgi:hypothetical protein